MVNEINVVGLGSAQGLGYGSGVSPGVLKQSDARIADGRQGVDQHVVDVGAGNISFGTLASAKDDAAQIAKTVHEVDKTLAAAEKLLGEMRQAVQMVKNYPPFPPGNEDRINFIKSIDGLRKQMEALVVPPVAKSEEPVLYPKQSDLPLLDPATANDGQVVEFGKAVESLQTRLNASYGELLVQADRTLGSSRLDVPVPTRESDAMQVSRNVSGQLAELGQPVVSNSAVLAQLGG